MRTTTAFLMAMGLAAPAVFAQSAGAGDTYRQPQMQQQGVQGTQGDWSSGKSGTGSHDQWSSGKSGTGGRGNWSSGESGTTGHGNWSSGSSGGSGDAGYSRPESGSRYNAAPEVYAGPQQQMQNDVAYLCGGVGQNEAAYMKDQAKNYDMMLTFATRKGDYLANVDVDIKDGRGDSILQTTCDGPMLLVDVPNGGTYHIHAEASGYSLNRTAHVSGGHNRRQRVSRVAMVWPERVGVFGDQGMTATGSSGTGGRSSAERGGMRGEDANSPRSRMYQENNGSDSR